MDLLRVLSSPDLEVRKKTLDLALELVSPGNIEEVYRRKYLPPPPFRRIVSFLFALPKLLVRKRITILTGAIVFSDGDGFEEGGAEDRVGSRAARCLQISTASRAHVAQVLRKVS